MIRNRDVDTGRFEFGFLKSLLLIVNYFFGYQLAYPFIASLIFPSYNGAIHPRANMLSILITLIISVYLVFEPLKRSFYYFRNNLQTNIKIVFKNLGKIYLVNITVSMLLMFLLDGMRPGNQEILEEGFSQLPILYAFTAVVFAPIVEEIIFRGVLYQQLRNRKSYYFPIVISSISFGLIHVLPIYLLSGNPFELLYIIIYSAMGFMMVQAYEESGSIWTSISVHFLNNLIAVIVLFLS